MNKICGACGGHQKDHSDWLWNCHQDMVVAAKKAQKEVARLVKRYTKKD